MIIIRLSSYGRLFLSLLGPLVFAFFLMAQVDAPNLYQVGLEKMANIG